MVEPLSPNHVFDFSVDDPAHNLEDPKEEFEEEPEEEPKEQPEEEPNKGPEEVIGVSSITPSPLSESSSDFKFTALVTADRAVWLPPSGSTFEVGGPSSLSSLPPHLLAPDVKRLKEDTETIYGSVKTLERGMRTHQTEIAANHFGVDIVKRRMDAFDVDVGFIEMDATGTSDHALVIEEENHRLMRRVDSLEVSNTLAAMSEYRIEREFSSLCVWLTEMLGGDDVEARPMRVLMCWHSMESLNPQGRRDHLMVPSRFTFITMPPRRLKRRVVERLVKNQVAEAIAEFERNRTNQENAGRSGGTGGANEDRGAGAGEARGVIAPEVND
ncbi:hypothetical protein Tco_0922557 [Tanacetum coccineum]|uniref:Uncharacterized protein n=1 Tax=Tanacetum coccineum TaxID=301880 RepID=A0ABQ5CZH2_9ASTR